MIILPGACLPTPGSFLKASIHIQQCALVKSHPVFPSLCHVFAVLRSYMTLLWCRISTFGTKLGKTKDVLFVTEVTTRFEKNSA